MKVLFKFSKDIPADSIVIDTTSNSGDFSGLSPFVLPAPPAKRFENLWQFSKVYKKHLDKNGYITDEWFKWQNKGFNDFKAHRYPMGKGAIPEFTYWELEQLGYIEARKRLYVPHYANNVIHTDGFKRLAKLYSTDGDRLVLLDYDAYDHQALGMSLGDVLNNPERKMGHAFVLMMMLTGEIKELL